MTREKTLHPAVSNLLSYFTYLHLQDDLQEVSKLFSELAHTLVEKTSLGLDGAEATVGLRKLLEAKDCFVRAALRK